MASQRALLDGAGGAFFFTVFRVPITIPETNIDIQLMEDILHQLIGSLSDYLQGFIHPRWLAGFLPSTVAPENGWLEDDCFLLGGFVLDFQGRLVRFTEGHFVSKDHQLKRRISWGHCSCDIPKY